jgi:hypothetical protein
MPSAVVIKAIKPKRFDDKAMTERLRYHAKQVVKEIRKDFEETTKTWQHKVEFKETVSAGKGAGGIIAEVSTTDEIYTYVDQGTKPHIIRPVRAKRLAFPSIFSPKTAPRVLSSGPGQRGPQDTFAMEVHHPGTEAREFSRTIEVKWTPRFKQRMQEAMKDAAKASGHSIK